MYDHLTELISMLQYVSFQHMSLWSLWIKVESKQEKC